MINQAIKSTDNVFAPMQSNGASYAITKPFTQTQEQDKEQENERKGNRLGTTIAKIALVAGFGIFILTQIVSKKSRLRINDLVTKLSDKISKLPKGKQLSAIEKFYYGTLKSTRELLEHSKAIFNLASIKDVLVRKGLKQTKTLDKISNGITNFFEKISILTSRNSYRRTFNHFDSMLADLSDSTKNLPTEQAELIKQKIVNIKNLYSEGFSESARRERLTNAKKEMDGIDEKVWAMSYHQPLKFIKSKEARTRFIAEDLAHDSKMNFNNIVNAIKEKITVSASDNYNTTKRLMNELNLVLDPRDKNSRDLMWELKRSLKDYNKNFKSSGGKDTRFPKNEISQKLSELRAYILNTDKYKPEAVENISIAIDKLSKALSENKKGEIQNIMDIYKEYLPESDYQKLEKAVNKSIKSLNYSVDLEADKLFDKVRDLLIGSAPKDTVAVLASLGVVGWGLTKADNNDERTSVLLKYGIPVVGGVTISLICAVGLIASGPSLLIGAASGLLINKLGEVADSVRKKYQHKQPTLESTAENIKEKINPK